MVVREQNRSRIYVRLPVDDCRAPTEPDGSRVNVVIPPLALDGPVLTIRPLPAPRLQRRRAGRQRHADAAAARVPRARGPLPREHPRLRRHRLRQDDHAERPVELHRGRGAGGHDRGRRRAPAVPAARRAARGAPTEPRGPRRGDDPPARAKRAAHEARPDRRRRGPRAGNTSLSGPPTSRSRSRSTWLSRPEQPAAA